LLWAGDSALVVEIKITVVYALVVRIIVSEMNNYRFRNEQLSFQK
jgi:hypothetical protein